MSPASRCTLFAACVTAAALAAQRLALPGTQRLARPAARVSSGVETFIPANDANVWTTGRALENADGSKSFDWEGYTMNLNVQGASYVRVVINATDGILGRFIVESDGWEVASFYVGGGNNAIGTNTFFAAYDLYQTRHIRVVSIIEPAFAGGNAGQYFTFVGFATDGTAAPPTPRTRFIELVGDSISAGYGSRGHAGTPYGCPVDINTSGNYYSYNWRLAEAFSAYIHPIAWSGKGMYENCCDNGITMPSLYLQTLAGRAYSTDWHFPVAPDLLLINLGTNDFNHDTGAAWEAAFTATYVTFVANATARYKKPALPIGVLQGPMDCGAALNASLQRAIAGINAAGGDAFYINACVGATNDGCGGHPGVVGHANMFAAAQPVIAAKMRW